MSGTIPPKRANGACAGVCGGHVAACLIFTLRLTAVMLMTEARRSGSNEVRDENQHKVAKAMRRLFFPAPSNGSRSALGVVGLIIYGIGWIWLLLWLIAEIAALIVDWPVLFSDWPSSIGQWAIAIGIGILLFPMIGLVGFLLCRGLLYVLANR